MSAALNDSGLAPLDLAIIGPGALGRSIGALIERGGAKFPVRVSYVGRGGRVEGSPLPVDDAGRPGWPADSTPERRRMVLVTTKAYDTRQATEDARPLLEGDADIVSLQNGFGNVEVLRAFQRERTYAGATTHAARRMADGSVQTVSLGRTAIALAVDEPVEVSTPRFRALFNVANALRARGLPIDSVEDGPQLLWRKLVVSSGVNALTAIERCTNGELLGRRKALARAFAAAAETLAVGRARGHALATVNSEELLRAVCEGTANNRSSMLQDIEAGRRTEVREINGAVVAEAAKTHLKDAPVNRALLEEILTLEARRPRESAPPETLTRHGR